MADRVSASHILITHTESPNTKATRSLEEIKGIRKELEDSAIFAELASSRSDCPSKSRGRYLGKFCRGQMVPPFETAAFELDVGSTSEIIETEFGCHLIYRDG